MELAFFIVGGACCLLRIDGNITIGIDPFLAPAGTTTKGVFLTTTRNRGPVYLEDDWNSVDFWLLTHDHFDHVDDLGLARISADTPLYFEPALQKRLSEYRQAQPLEWGQSSVFSRYGYEITITAIPAYHGSSRLTLKVAGPVNGYLVTIKKDGEEKTVYFTSDTVFRQEIPDALSEESIDFMIANMGEVFKGKMGGPLTLSLEMLNELQEALSPAVTIPIHNDDYSHYTPVGNDIFADAGYRIIEQGRWTILNP